MTKKRSSLTDALSGAADTRSRRRPSPAAAADAELRQVNFRMNAEAARQLKLLATEQDLTLQDALAQAVNLYFEHHGRNPIA